MNPLLEDWKTPFGLPPFSRIADGDFAPAFEAASPRRGDKVDAIAADPAPPTFANTIEALERSDRALGRVAAVFFGLAGADTNDALEALQRDLSPQLAAHRAETMLNARALRPRRRADGREGRARPDAGAGAGADSLPPHVRPGGRAARGRRAGAAEGDARAPRQPDHDLRPERPRRRAHLGAAPSRPADLEGLPPDLVAAMAEAAASRARPGHS